MTKREKELEDLFQRWMKKQGEEKGWEKTTVGGREILRIHLMYIQKELQKLLRKMWNTQKNSVM